MNEELKNKLRLNTRDYKFDFDKAVEVLDKFFFLISNKNKELNVKICLNWQKENTINSRLGLLKSF